MDVPASVVKACQRGDPEAFERLVELTHRQVYTLALRLVGNPEDAADVTQETFMKLLRVIGSFRGESKFSTWLYRVASNVAISHIRKRSRRAPQVSLDSPQVGEIAATAPGSDPASEAEGALSRQALEEALARLPEGYRIVVVMKDVYGFRIREIASQMKLTESAVKVRLFRARRRLKEILIQEDSEEEK